MQVSLNEMCNRYGWSRRYFQTEDTGVWAVEIQVGVRPGDFRLFMSEDVSPNTKKGRKIGQAAAACVALKSSSLQREIQRLESRETIAFNTLFRQMYHGRVMESSRESWDIFWRSKSTVVGIDCEGISVSPPLMVQIATDSLVIIEIGTISDDLVRLLADGNIKKVFYDPTGGDKSSLGLDDPWRGKNCIDVNELAEKLAGPTDTARGLIRIVTLASPTLNKTVVKDENCLYFIQVERGIIPKPRRMKDVPQQYVEYAAMDAYFTLYAYRGLLAMDQSMNVSKQRRKINSTAETSSQKRQEEVEVLGVGLSEEAEEHVQKKTRQKKKAEEHVQKKKRHNKEAEDAPEETEPSPKKRKKSKLGVAELDFLELVEEPLPRKRKNKKKKRKVSPVGIRS